MRDNRPVADDLPTGTTEKITWDVPISPHPAGGYRWEVSTRHPLWVPLAATGRADTEEGARAVARTVATRCTEAVRRYIQGTGIRDVRFALMTAFPDESVGGGTAVGQLSLGGARPPDKDDRWIGLESRATDWQTRGGRQKFVALDSAEEQSGWRLRELFGCMGALGEQAMLACAAARDLAGAVAAPDSPQAELVRRAWAEHVIHWTMAAGHMLLNVAGRAVALNPAVRPHLLERQGAKSENSRRKALRTEFPHESEANDDWPTFSKTNANYLKRSAAESVVPAVAAVGELVHRVAIDERWITMTDLRNEAFHRWRAQTLGVSTMARRATRVVGDDGLLPGGRLPDVGGPEGSAKAVECAEGALELLGEALTEFDRLLPEVMSALTSTVMHADGLLASYGTIALIESSRGTGVMVISLKPERVHDFVHAVSARKPAAGADDT